MFWVRAQPNPYRSPLGRGAEVGEAQPNLLQLYESFYLHRSGRSCSLINRVQMSKPSLFHPTLAFVLPQFHPLDEEARQALILFIHKYEVNFYRNVYLLFCLFTMRSLTIIYPQKWRMRYYAFIYFILLETQTCLWDNGIDNLFSGNFLSSLQTERYCLKSLLPVIHYSISNRWLRRCMGKRQHSELFSHKDECL